MGVFVSVPLAPFTQIKLLAAVLAALNLGLLFELSDLQSQLAPQAPDRLETLLAHSYE